MVLLVAVTVAAGAAVGAGLLAVDPPTPPPRAALSLSVDPAADRLTLTHLGGDPLDVRELSLCVLVDGEPLSHQPPVPFFAARGFRGGPTGPFNPAADSRWTPGETASFRLASTNAPALVPGSTVTVVVAVRGATVARLTRRAGAVLRRVGGVDRFGWTLGSGGAARSGGSDGSTHLLGQAAAAPDDSRPYSPVVLLGYYSGTRASETMARGLAGRARMVRWSTSS